MVNQSGSSTGKEMLIFDGDCGFCTKCANRIRQRLPSSVRVLPYQYFRELDQYGLTLADVKTASCWIDADRIVWSGSASISRALISIGGGWKIVGMVLNAPGIKTLAKLIYATVAKFRHRLPGGTTECQINDAADSDK